MDERQIQIRGKIFLHTTIGLIIFLLGAVFIQDFGIYDIVKNIGFSNFLLTIIILTMTYAICAALLNDAYFGIHYQRRLTVFMYFFFMLAILEDSLFVFDCIRKEGPFLITIANLLMVNSISLSFLYKRRSNHRN